MKYLTKIAVFVVAIMLYAQTTLGEHEDAGNKPDWKSTLSHRLSELGHRNWIVVADSAYPAQTRNGIETIVTHDSQVNVVKTVMEQLAKAKHVRPVIYLDKELNYVLEADAPDISAYRNELKKLLAGAEPKRLPHEQILAKLDQTGAQFKVLVLKTDLTLPYTSVFFELDCRYWSPDAEARLREAISHDAK